MVGSSKSSGVMASKTLADALHKFSLIDHFSTLLYAQPLLWILLNHKSLLVLLKTVSRETFVYLAELALLRTLKYLRRNASIPLSRKVSTSKPYAQPASRTVCGFRVVEIFSAILPKTPASAYYDHMQHHYNFCSSRCRI